MGACACDAYAYLEVVYQHVKEHCRFVVSNFRQCKFNKYIWGKIVPQSGVTTYATLRY